MNIKAIFEDISSSWASEIELIRQSFIKKYVGENLPSDFGQNLKDPICVILGTNHEEGRVEAARDLAIFVNLANATIKATPEEIRHFIEQEALEKTRFARTGLDIRRAHEIVEERHRARPSLIHSIIAAVA